MSKKVSNNAPFGANSGFFHIIKEGLEGLVNGKDYFDLLAEDVVFEYVISGRGTPGGSKDGRTSSTSTAIQPRPQLGKDRVDRAARQADRCDDLQLVLLLTGLCWRRS